ncbi:hypothetical protein CPter91_3237 [Collimonas pratensis]|uniref:Uncharacterized protein n=1 Tax=Collimonas pratensis TaxID=279113 RepID=A0A127Q678_9BURK|nr:hypothetical protein CPter91_3237 [Collimonas pratensis]
MLAAGLSRQGPWSRYDVVHYFPSQLTAAVVSGAVSWLAFSGV